MSEYGKFFKNMGKVANKTPKNDKKINKINKIKNIIGHYAVIILSCHCRCPRLRTFVSNFLTNLPSFGHCHATGLEILTIGQDDDDQLLGNWLSNRRSHPARALCRRG